MMNKILAKRISAFMMFLMFLLSACTPAQTENRKEFQHRYATKTEGKKLMLSNQEYYDGFSQNDLDYKMQKKNATMDEYLLFAGEQARDFSDEEKVLIDDTLKAMEKKLEKNGYDLPKYDEIVFIKTTMKEEGGAGAYTHGNQIYIGPKYLDSVMNETKSSEVLEYVLWHELFHCLTRYNPEFRADMYELIHFTVVEKDFQLPPSVFEYHISNPDVEHHNSYASFHINGQDINCFVDFVTTKHFEEEGETLFDCSTTALVPIDGSDIYYTPKDADNFDEVFGTNTDYVIDPEECMADNFAYALVYGMDGPNGEGYPSPGIIEGILAYISTK